MKWLITLGILSIGAIGAVSVALYRLDVVTRDVSAMPAPSTHIQVHKVGDQRVSYLEKDVEQVKKNQEEFKAQIYRIEINSYQAAQDTAVIIEKLDGMMR